MKFIETIFASLQVQRIHFKIKIYKQIQPTAIKLKQLTLQEPLTLAKQSQ